MKETTTITVGMDVHKDSISYCVLRGDDRTFEEGKMANELKPVLQFFRKLQKQGNVRTCYEAGPCGYELRRQLEKIKIDCDVIAPSLIPRASGDRVKTDRRDARKLAKAHRAGDLTPIRIPKEDEESVRDLVRCREDIMEDLRREQHRLLKFLLRRGRIWRDNGHWSKEHWRWLRSQKFEHVEAQLTFDEYLVRLTCTLERRTALETELQKVAEKEPWRSVVNTLSCLRGIKVISALTIAAEIQDFRRFRSPKQLMSFLGLTPSIYASANKARRGGITKAGNAHARRILVEAAWHYRHRPNPHARMKGASAEVQAHAMKAQRRLYERFKHLDEKNKPRQVTVIALARELVGFIWALLVKLSPEPTTGERIYTIRPYAQA